jgi:ribosomal protein L37E
MQEAQQHEKYCPDCGKVFYSSGTRCANCGYQRPGRTRAPYVSLADRLHPYRRRLFTLLALSALGWTTFCLYRKNPDMVTSALARLRASLQPAPTPRPLHRPAVAREVPRTRIREIRTVVYRTPAETPALVAVPSLIGLTLEEATERVESRGLQLVEHRPRVLKAGFEEGEVFRQSLPPGKRVPQDSVIFVRVAGWAAESTPSPGPEPSPLGDPTRDSVETPQEAPEPEEAASPAPPAAGTTSKMETLSK